MEPQKISFDTLSVLAPHLTDAHTGDGFLIADHDFASTPQITGRPFVSELFVILLCTRGEATVIIDAERHTMCRNTLLMVRPGARVTILDTGGAMVHGAAFHPAVCRQIPVSSSELTNLQLKTIASPSTQLTAEGHRRMQRLLRALQDVVGDGCKGPVVSHAIAMVLCTVGDLLEQSAPKRSTTSLHNDYMSRFLELVAAHYTRHRAIGFYADRLHLTPKYLTTIVRRMSGKTASEWITESVIREACHRLRFGRQNIQQIAYDLNFPNQSFFGSYFRKHTGISPSEYRSR